MKPAPRRCFKFEPGAPADLSGTLTATLSHTPIAIRSSLYFCPTQSRRSKFIPRSQLASPGLRGFGRPLSDNLLLDIFSKVISILRGFLNLYAAPRAALVHAKFSDSMPINRMEFTVPPYQPSHAVLCVFHPASKLMTTRASPELKVIEFQAPTSPPAGPPPRRRCAFLARGTRRKLNSFQIQIWADSRVEVE